MRPEDHIVRPRDSVRERNLAERLRGLPEEERFRFISEILDKDQFVGLELANRCLVSGIYFRAILDRGLDNARTVRIDLWLKCVIPHLGYRKVVYLVIDKLSTEPTGLERAFYYLAVYLPNYDDRAVAAFIRLRDSMREHGLNTTLKPE